MRGDEKPPVVAEWSDAMADGFTCAAQAAKGTRGYHESVNGVAESPREQIQARLAQFENLSTKEKRLELRRMVARGFSPRGARSFLASENDSVHPSMRRFVKRYLRRV